MKIKIAQTKVRGRYDVDTKEARIQHTQDVGGILDEAKAARDMESYRDKNAELRQWASIPFTVVLEIKDRYGIDIMRAKGDEMKKVRKIIERDYAYLKTTNERIAR